MKKISALLVGFVCFNLIGCSSEKHQFPLDKPYWDNTDYQNVIQELKFGYEADEKLPTFADSETAEIVSKLTDTKNFNVILDDEQLGLNHKNEEAEKFFNNWRDMNTIYQATDRKDQLLYEEEMLKVWKFGLELQIKYFKLGNDNVLKNADDPNSEYTQRSIHENINKLIGNYSIFIDFINEESAFSEKGKDLYAKILQEGFTQLITIYPKEDYTAMREKIELMSKKTTSEKIKTSLAKIKELIDSKSKENNGL